MDLRSHALALAVVALFCGNACLAQKTAVDPNSRQDPAGAKPADARLNQRVSHEVWHTPLKTILAELSKRTGVTLNAGYNKQDWQVRDRKMSLYVKDVSLAALMESIARVMKFKWSANADATPPTYRIVADRKLLAKLQAEATNRRNLLRQEISRRRAACVEALGKVFDASASELAKLWEENPYLYICAETGFAKLATQMFNEAPGMEEMFVSGDKNLIPPLSVFSPATQQLYADVLQAAWKYDAILRGTKKPPANLESKLAGHAAHMELVLRPSEGNLREQLWNFGGMGTPISTGHYVVGSFADPDSELARIQGETAVEAADAGADREQVMKKATARSQAAELASRKEIEEYLMLDPVSEHADEPGLHGKIVVKIGEEAKKLLDEQTAAFGAWARPRLNYQAAQKAIADAASVSIVSDSFAVVVGDYRPGGSEEELVKVLEAITDAYRCNWDQHGSILELRRRDWFRRRASQIPDEWVESWRDEIERTGTLTLQHYAQMATLDEEQIAENINTDPVLRDALGIWWAALNNEGFLRFYLRLDPKLRDMIFSEEGLSPHALNPAQWQAYTEMFHYGRRWAWGTEAFGNSGDAKVTIKGKVKSGSDGHQIYSFKVSLEGDGETMSDNWDVEVPKIARRTGRPSARTISP